MVKMRHTSIPHRPRFLLGTGGIKNNKIILFVHVFRVFFAVYKSSREAGKSSSFVPGYKRARMAADHVMALIDRKSPIDNFSKDGIGPVSVTY